MSNFATRRYASTVYAIVVSVCLKISYICPSLYLATPLHHLHIHPLFLQHLTISPLSHLLNLKSSRFFKLS